MNSILRVLLPFALAHLLSYLYRTVNAVVYPELSKDLALSANNIGLLTSAYFLMFAIAQLPVGVALDRYGPRRVQPPMLFIAAIGAFLFAYAGGLVGLITARALIGFGVAACLMAAIKGSSLWFAPEKLPLTTSVLLSVGGLGAMLSTAPMHITIEYLGWRNAFLLLGVVTLCISALIFFAVPEHEKHKVPSETNFHFMFLEVKTLFRAWSFWRLALYSLVAHATYMSIQGLWLGPWLTDVKGLSSGSAATLLLFGTVSMFFGSLFFGWLTDRLRRFRVEPIMVCGSGICFFIFFQCLMISDIDVSPAILAIGFSFFGTSTTMNYAIVAQSVPSNLTGRVSTSFNLVLFLLAFLLQWGFGEIINLWESVGGSYPSVAYQYGLGLLVILQVPGLFLWLSFKPWKRRLVIA